MFRVHIKNDVYIMFKEEGKKLSVYYVQNAYQSISVRYVQSACPEIPEC